MVISAPVNSVDGRVRLSWHRYTHLTHTQTHTAVIIIKPDCKTSLAACQSKPVPNSLSWSKTHRQVRRLGWTEPLLSLLGFSDPATPFSPQFVFPLLLWQWLLLTFLSLTSPLWSTLLKSKSLQGRHQDINLCDSLPGPAGLENQGWGAVCSQTEGWKPFWAELD